MNASGSQDSLDQRSFNFKLHLFEHLGVTRKVGPRCAFQVFIGRVGLWYLGRVRNSGGTNSRVVLVKNVFL